MLAVPTTQFIPIPVFPTPFPFYLLYCVMSTLCADGWDSAFCLYDYCREELYFWKGNLINLNSGNCFVSKDPSYFVYSDASATGGGAFIDFVCHKVWTENEGLQSSTLRELSVISL